MMWTLTLGLHQTVPAHDQGLYAKRRKFPKEEATGCEGTQREGERETERGDQTAQGSETERDHGQVGQIKENCRRSRSQGKATQV